MDAGSSSEFSEEKLIAFTPQQKMCAILSMVGGSYTVYIVDIVLEDGAADDVEIVDLDRVYPYGSGRQFVPRDPNLMFLGFNASDCLCGIGATIFMFEGIDYRELKIKVFGDDTNTTLPQRVGIYSFPLSAEHLAMPPPKYSPSYDKSQLHKDSDMLGLKCAPQAVPVQYDTSRILVFSTEIEYFNDITNFDGPVVDFEIYNIESKLSVKLPPLHIGRLNATIFMLADLARDQKYYFTPKYDIEEYPRNGEWRPSFLIRAFTFFGDHTFVVEPDFGGVRFSLDLASDSEKQKWELFDVPMFFPRDYQHFISRNNLILSSYGACKVGYEYEPCEVVGYEPCEVFPFPLCSYISPRFGRKNSSIILLEHTRYPEHVACIVQVGKDDYETPFWTMDVIKLNDRKFEDGNEDGQFARRMKSFKFVNLCSFVGSTIVGLFAF